MPGSIGAVLLKQHCRQLQQKILRQVVVYSALPGMRFTRLF